MILAALAVGAVLSAAPAASPAIVVLPFDNFSGSDDEPRELAALFAKEIARRGWRVVPTDDVEPLLEKHRVRYLDSLDDQSRADILAATGATAIVSGTLYTYTEGRTPTVALTGRMVRADGTFAWGDVAGLSSDDTEKALGFGRSDKAEGVATKAIDRLTRHFPNPAEEGSLVRGPQKPLFHAGPISFRASDRDPATPHRICVLPFDNSSSNDAVRIVADVLSLRLAAASGFEVVEPAALRQAALKANIASFRWISSDDLRRLAPVVGTPLFLRGTIYQFDDPAESRSSPTPQIQMEMTLVDVQSGRVLWSAQHARKGTDYTGFLMLGAVSNVLTLTDRVVSEMIATGTHPKKMEKNDEARTRNRGTRLARRRDPAQSNPAAEHPAGDGQR